MKKSIITLSLLTISLFGMAQSKKQANPKDKLNLISGTGVQHNSTKDTVIFTAKLTDTVYYLKESDLNRIYNLLSAGQQGVNTSDNFSINQRKLYQSEFIKVDSAFRPQLLKWHPPVKKK